MIILKKDLSNWFAVALQRTGRQFHLFEHVMAEDRNENYVESQQHCTAASWLYFYIQH